MDPYSLVSSMANWIWGVHGVDVLEELVSVFYFLDDKGIT